MKRTTSRNLYLSGVVLALIAAVLLVIASGAVAANPDSPNGTFLGILAIVAGILIAVGSLIAFIAFIGALIKLAMLGQWVWFILLIALNGVMMLVYIFAGPTEPKSAA